MGFWMWVCVSVCAWFSVPHCCSLLPKTQPCKVIHPSWTCAVWTLISQTSVHVCDCDLAISLTFALDPATRSKTYLCQPYLKSGFHPPCWLLLWYFSVSHSFFPSLLPPLFPPSPVVRISSIIHVSLPFPLLSLSLSFLFFFLWPVLIQDVPVWVVELPKPWRGIGALGTLVSASPCVGIVSMG